MVKVALTGGIATGKSHVLARLRSLGVSCLDADELAHGVTAAGTEATLAIAGRFGAGVLGPDGAVNRAALGKVVFADEGARRDLEAIVHPAVYRAIAAGLKGFERLGEPLVVVDIPLLFETGRAGDFDVVVATVCSLDRQRERLRARGLSEEEIDGRLAAQMSAAEKATRAEHVIGTDGTFAETDAAIDRVLSAIRARASRN